MTEDRYLETLEKTRAEALASVSAMSVAEKLHALADFHDTARQMAKSQFGGRETAIAEYHGILRDAANLAAAYIEGMH